MSTPLPGIHHVTAIAGDPQRNVDFYAGTLGLRLVKRTVNFDDPGTYHLYYGDEQGRPGTILTFFPWPGGAPGRRGAGQTGEVALAIPTGSLGFWLERLVRAGVRHEGPAPRFRERVVSFADPDGLALELVTDRRPADDAGWAGGGAGGGVPAEHAIRGVRGVALWEAEVGPTAALLTETLGFRFVGEEGNRARYAAPRSGPGQVVDLVRAAGFWSGAMGVGAVHHVAWRAADDGAQEGWRRTLASAGLNPTAALDRRYFRSIYFREPGGVLFEIATDAPGFGVDESPAALGTRLQLPPWLEVSRREIERGLPPLRPPGDGPGPAGENGA